MLSWLATNRYERIGLVVLSVGVRKDGDVGGVEKGVVKCSDDIWVEC